MQFNVMLKDIQIQSQNRIAKLKIFVQLTFQVNKIESSYRMEKSPVEMNVSDSLIKQQLPNYGDNFLNGKSEENSSYNLSSYSRHYQRKPFKGSFFEKYYDKIVQENLDYSKERAQIFKCSKDPIRQVIELLAKNEELDKKVEQKQNQLQGYQQDQQNFTNQVQEVTIKNQQLQDQIHFFEAVGQFQQKIKGLLRQEKLFLNQRQQPFQVVNQLMRKLNERSQGTFQKLKPYLEYSAKKLSQQNSVLQATSKKLENERELYKQQISKQQNYIKQKQQLRSIYQVQDQIENEIRYGSGLDKFNARYEADLELKSKRIRQRQ